MNPFLILIAGIVVVLAGILILRLHAVLALLLGALTVGLLTSPHLLTQYATSKSLTPQ